MHPQFAGGPRGDSNLLFRGVVAHGHLRTDVFYVYATGKSDKAHSYVGSLGDAATSRHYAVQPRSIGSYERHKLAAHQLCLNDSFSARFVDEGDQPELINSLNAIRRGHFKSTGCLGDQELKSTVTVNTERFEIMLIDQTPEKEDEPMLRW
jgi:hypothetical protein